MFAVQNSWFINLQVRKWSYVDICRWTHNSFNEMLVRRVQGFWLSPLVNILNPVIHLPSWMGSIYLIRIYMHDGFVDFKMGERL